MIIAATVTIPAVKTGYSLYDLLVAAAASPTELPVTGRVSELHLQRGSANAYIVPLTGTYVATTGNVPDQCGFIFSASFPILELSQHPANQISLKDINVGGDAANTTLLVLAYTV